MNKNNKPLAEELKDKDSIKDVLLPIVYSYKERREAIFNNPENNKNEQELKDKLRKIKEDSLNNIQELKQKAIKNLTKNGIKVIEVKTLSDAEREIKKIVGQEKLIVKSKSNTANEINLREILKDKELVETDLGDFVVENLDAEDLHPVLPAMHLTPERISASLGKKFNQDIKPTPEAIAEFAREKIRHKIQSAKIGITGANVITADGSIIILENEGNISLVSRIPETHIVLSSFDKIVATRQEALHVVECASIYGTGQEYPMYVNIISGPSKTADIQNKIITGAQGTKEVCLILIDNGRTEILNSEFKELLYCINCGSCLNFCPVFHQLTTRYGSKNFPGAKGVLYSFFTESPKESFNNGAFFCTTCRMCVENCPAKIDLSAMIKKLRSNLADKGIEPENVKDMLNLTKEHGTPFGKATEGKLPDKLYCC